MKREELYELLAAGESHTAEFKPSLNRGAVGEGIESLVAFANADGGRVLFGVENDGAVRGVQLGKKTLEDLANDIKSHTYPSLPVHLEVHHIGGMTVVMAEVVRDVPPLVGVYLRSSTPLPPDAPIETGVLDTFRRVGRTNQKQDFMVLRRPLPSDPKLSLRMMSVSTYVDNPLMAVFRGRVWVEEGSATAHNVRFRLQPWGETSDYGCPDLPYPLLKRTEEGLSIQSGFYRYEGFAHGEDFTISDVDVSTVPSFVEVTATYEDEWGVTWQAARRSELTFSREPDTEGSRLLISETGEFHKRIVSFPAKVAMAGERA